MNLISEQTNVTRNYEKVEENYKYYLTTNRQNQEPIHVDMQIHKLVEENENWVGSIVLADGYKNTNILQDEDIVLHLGVFDDFLDTLE